MMLERRPIPIPRDSPAPSDRLESWKDIAAFLGREVRTVQNWEKTEGLPIHRLQHSKQGSVFAFKSELNTWRMARTSVPDSASEAPPAPPPTLMPDPPELPPDSRRYLPWIAGAAVVITALAGVAFWMTRPPRISGEALSSVVVLPFLDLSQAKDQEYFSDGLTEEIIDALSRVPNLRVVARTSAFAFKNTAKDVRQIGKELSVAAVLEGSVRKAGDQLRITAQLNRASDGFHLWSKTFTRQMRDIFAVQQEISQSIADQLGAGKVSVRGASTDLEAYRLFEEGRYFFNKFEPPEGNYKAIERYQQAIARDPKFALAYAGLADAYSYLIEFDLGDPAEITPKAKAAAQKAVELDPLLGEGHTALGIVKLDFEWDVKAADSELRRAAELNPSSGYVAHWIGHSLEAQGRLDDAIRQFQSALAVDPLAMPIYWDLASDLVLAGRFAEANALMAKSEELFPSNPAMLTIELLQYLRQRDFTQAHRIRDLLKGMGDKGALGPFLRSALAYEAVLEGNRAFGEAELKAMEHDYQLDPKGSHNSTGAMLVAASLGDHQAVMTWLKRMYELRAPLCVYAPLYFRKELEPFPEAREYIAKMLK